VIFGLRNTLTAVSFFLWGVKRTTRLLRGLVFLRPLIAPVRLTPSKLSLFGLPPFKFRAPSVPLPLFLQRRCDQSGVVRLHNRPLHHREHGGMIIHRGSA